MNGEYLGHLSKNDRMYDYLQYDIFPGLGCSHPDGIRVFGTNGSNAVYIYEERRSNVKAVGKFFYSQNMRDRQEAERRMEREWNNLHHARAVLGGCHYVARPLGRNADLGCLLVTEFCTGMPLEEVINRAIYNKEEQLLHDKLRALAGFLAEMHNRSAQDFRVDFNAECRYFRHLSDTLVRQGFSVSNFDRLKEYWHDTPAMWDDCAVKVHGDATPANFFFGDGMYVISFDLERMKLSDRCFDLGRLAGEIQHFFLRSTGNKYLAEPFISGFLHNYCSYFPDRHRALEAISLRMPFYMGATLLRIARNSYLTSEYRSKLISEAALCLKR